jgi:hypothetical protein
MQQLKEYGEIEATYARHSRYFAQLMLQHETGLKHPQQLETMQAIERDFENFRLACEWLLILLACLREDYAEGARLNETGTGHSTNTMGFQLLFWALATLSCGVGRLAEIRVYIQKALQRSVSHANLPPDLPCGRYPEAAANCYAQHIGENRADEVMYNSTEDMIWFLQLWMSSMMELLSSTGRC